MNQVTSKALKTKPNKLVVGIVALILVVAGAALLTFLEGNKPTSGAVTILPVPAPKQGERFRDIPTQDAQRRTDFLRAGAAEYRLSARAELTPKAVATACVADATAQIANQARTTESYRKNPAKIQADIKAVNQNCYAKYSETDYKAPPKAQSHVNPDTFTHP